MKSTSLKVLILIAAYFSASLEVAAQNDSSTAPTIEHLMTLEKQATGAWARGDSKFSESLLSDKFVMRDGRQRVSKAAVVKRIADGKCDFKISNFDGQWLARVDADTYVLSYSNKFDGTCAKSGTNPITIQGSTRAATVWIRNGNKWQAAFHGENLIIDPATQKVLPSAGLGVKTTARRSDADTKTLAAIETAVWEAWKNHDLKKLDYLTANSLSFIDIFGNSYDNRDIILKTWSSNVCKVKSVKVTDAVAFALSPTVKLLTHTGTADGTCYGQKIGPIYGNSVYVKDGKDWKLAFTMNMPGM